MQVAAALQQQHGRKHAELDWPRNVEHGITMMIESAMLNVNRTSSATGGNGNTTMARTASTPTGTPTPVRRMSRTVGMADVEVAVAMSQCLVLQCFVVSESIFGSIAGGCGGDAPSRRAVFSW